MIPRIGLTIGDPGGIGPEVLLKSIETVGLPYIPVVVGPLEILDIANRLITQPIQLNPVASFDNLTEGTHVYDCVEPILQSITFGQESEESGRISYLSVVEAVKLASRKVVDAIVTAPISKASWSRAGYHYPGHTELLAGLTKTEDYGMMMVSGELKVLLVTTHLPLLLVPPEIRKGQVERKILLAERSLRTLFAIPKPRIAVCALNPHRGERGILGKEETEEIVPAVECCRSRGIDVEGPCSSDTIFLRRDEYDCIIAMYHDQGLIPFKLFSFGKGVNLTLGLPFVRTSPDHGTAYEIAGKGIADPSSMQEAIRLAVRLAAQKN
ncbi:MAG: hypothetical protein AMJ46_06580 [Latescibacteria bacterium DG_63]|nr:MAG: hypothetical protein AMJ46_06580 [Latescibacteria bacterium DG_63]